MSYDIFDQDILSDGDLNAITMVGEVLNADGYDEQISQLFADEFAEDQFNHDIHNMVYGESLEEEYMRMFCEMHDEHTSQPNVCKLYN